MALVPYDPQAAAAAAPTIDMNELLATRREAAHRKHSVYRAVLGLCHRRIRHNARTRPDCTWCVFCIPTFVPGLPRFDIDECTRYCLSKLRENGFEITLVPPQTIMISWQSYEKRAKRRAKSRRKLRASGLRLRRATASKALRRRGSYFDQPPPRHSDCHRREPPRPPAFDG